MYLTAGRRQEPQSIPSGGESPSSPFRGTLAWTLPSKGETGCRGASPVASPSSCCRLQAFWVVKEPHKMKEELDMLLAFSPGSPDCLVREDVMIVSSSNCLLDYSECGDDLQPSPKHMKLYSDSPPSPPSPDRQFCSSTTSMAGDMASTPSVGVKEDETPKRMCLVCGDIASGFHYGVASCEACKAFFKRTIQGNIDYTCPATNDCEINKRRRKACQACRFHKCLRVGMLKEGVRLDRVRGGRQKYRRTPESPYSIHQPPVKKASLEDIKLLASLRACEPEPLLARPDLTASDPEFVTVSTLAELYDRELVATIGWAKQIPGFTELTLNDQMRLLQSTWGEILTLGLAYRSIPAQMHTLTFARDFRLDEEQARDCNATELFTQVAGVVERLEQCNINKEEFLILKALVLTNSDVRLQDVQALHRLRQNILQALHDTVSAVRSREVVAQVQALLLCLPSLRAADAALRRYWLSVRHQGIVPMNKLFIEMLESHMR